MTELALFTIFIIFFWLLPGNLIYKTLKLKDSVLFQFLFSLITGLTIFFYVSFIIRFFNLPYVISSYLVYGLIFIYYLITCKSELLKNRLQILSFKKLLPGAVIFILSVYLLSAMHLNSGYKEGSFYASATRDGLWRISIVEELKNRFPPDHPGFAYEPLKNYHYFYDFIIASTGLLTNIQSTSLYYYYFTLLSGSVFVLSTFLFIRLFVKTNLFRNIGVILTVFTGNVSFLLPFISKQYDFFAINNIFMSDQPFDQGFNPFNLLTYGMFLFIIYLLHKWEEKPEWKITILFSLIAGFLPGIKIYAGFILFGALSLVILRLIVKRSRYAVLFSLPYLIFLPFYAIIKGTMTTSIIFKPLWLLDHMMSDLDRLNVSNVTLKEQHYKSTGNYLRIIQIKIGEFLVYLFGNLNTRIFAIPWILSQFKRLKTITYTNQFIITAIIISISIPLLFIQSRRVYDIIQFTPYGLILLSIISVGVIEKIVFRIDKKSRIVAAVVTIVIVVFSVITTLHFALDRIRQTPMAIQSEEIEALTYLRSNTNKDDVIFADLTGNKKEFMYIPALSGRRMYLSAPDLVEQTGIDPGERYTIVNTFEDIRSTKSISPKVTYIYLSEGGLDSVELFNSLGYDHVFSNNSVAIFKVN